mmetsp:Transcript_13233/g.46297  ORF Transcript_13233/g.46297 Transcript_13233/m.46297 type:complete len:209 (-) Transcript_13233:462-1088(-)
MQIGVDEVHPCVAAVHLHATRVERVLRDNVRISVSVPVTQLPQLGLRRHCRQACLCHHSHGQFRRILLPPLTGAQRDEETIVCARRLCLHVVVELAVIVDIGELDECVADLELTCRLRRRRPRNDRTTGLAKGGRRVVSTAGNERGTGVDPERVVHLSRAVYNRRHTDVQELVTGNGHEADSLQSLSRRLDRVLRIALQRERQQYWRL